MRALRRAALLLRSFSKADIDASAQAEDALWWALRGDSEARTVRRKSRQAFLCTGACCTCIAVGVAVAYRDPHCPLLGIAACATLLALQPTDPPRLIRGIAATAALAYAIALVQAVLQIADADVACTPARFAFPRRVLVYWAAIAAVACAVVPLLARRAFFSPCASKGKGSSSNGGPSSRPALHALWLAARLFYGVSAAAQIGSSVACHADGLAGQLCVSLVSLILLLVLFSYPVRRALQAWLARFLTERERRRRRRRSMSMAAGVARDVMEGREHWTNSMSVAELVGRRRPTSQLLQLGKARFRALPFSKLRREDLQTSADTGLHEQTVPVELGACDAFISHSWSDSPEHKWRSLSRWAREFEEREGREPRVWLDKACITQSAIDEQLGCLPIFVAGCREMIICAGPTYLDRLWCLIEETIIGVSCCSRTLRRSFATLI